MRLHQRQHSILTLRMSFKTKNTISVFVFSIRYTQKNYLFESKSLSNHQMLTDNCFELFQTFFLISLEIILINPKNFILNIIRGVLISTALHLLLRVGVAFKSLNWIALLKICQNTDFLWPVYLQITTES